MGVIDTLEPGTLGRVIGAYRDALRSHQDVINRLNVYPVPDGDTGTNMALTIESVVAELDKFDHPDMAVTSKAIAHGSLMGARGNSGVILSQLLRGIVDGLNESGLVPGPKDLARALTVADELARAAVMRPVEGTILTVARAAAEGARTAADAGKALIDVVGASRTAAAEALARTPELLPVLAQAGVVDAGGAGYLLLFDAILSVVDGRPLPEPPRPARAAERVGPRPPGHGRGGGRLPRRRERRHLRVALRGHVPAGGARRHHPLLQGGVGRDRRLHRGGGGRRALELPHPHRQHRGGGGGGAGCRPAPQHPGHRPARGGGGGALGAGGRRHRRERRARVSPGPPPTTGVVAVSTGVGIGRIFRSLGVHQVIAGGQSMNPSTAEILEAVELLRADEVIILPNNKNIRPVAERVDALTDKVVRVVPTNNIAEGFAALLAYDPEAHVDVNARDMETSARNVVAGEVTQAVRDSDSPVGKVATGDWLGLSRQGIEAVSNSVSQVAQALLDKLVTEDHELVTLIEGEGSSAADTRRITEWLGEHRPGVDTEVHQGGQPLYPYLFSIE